MKRLFLTGTKLVVAAALIFWLIKSDRLNFQVLDIYRSHMSVLFGNVFLWFFCSLLLGGWRWWLLVRGLDLLAGYWQVVKFQAIGFFFNTVMPGAVSGDLIKALYILREQPVRGKTRAMLTVLLDRVVGMSGLFLIAGTAILFSSNLLWSNPALEKIAWFILMFLVGVVLVVVLIFFPFKNDRDPFIKVLSLKLPGIAVFRQIYDALRSYRHRPLVLVNALLLTMIIQCANIWYAWYVTIRITGITPDIPIFAVLYSVGMVATVIPLAPGGLGIGHVAFDRLFHLVGINGGADVFNVLVLGQLCLNLLGVFFYLVHKRKEPLVGKGPLST